MPDDRRPNIAVTAPAAPPGAHAPPLYKREAVLAWRDTTGEREAVVRDATTVGSGPVPVCVVDPTVSRLHLSVEPTEEGVWIEDLGSRNGTFYEGARVARICVADGARIVAGKTEIRVRHTLAARPAMLFPAAKFGPLIGNTAVMRDHFMQLARVAGTNETVLVHGETGTGKELVAQAIHQASQRADGPFIVVDCGALPESLLESELFGHVKGAFTGAERDRRGAFEATDGGTLFLDEIGELPLAMQPKLLRALESRQVRRLGESEHRRVDVRFVCATHRDLAAMVNAGTFREDLYFRLAVLKIEVPPLRARAEDVPLLLQHFLPREIAQQPIDPEIEAALMARPWTGNVRELRNFAGRVAALGWRAAIEARVEAPRTSTAPSADPAPPARAGSAAPPEFLAGPYRESRDAVLEWWTRQYCSALSERHGFDPKRMADEAKVSLSYLWKLTKG